MAGQFGKFSLKALFVSWLLLSVSQKHQLTMKARVKMISMDVAVTIYKLVFIEEINK